MRGYLPLIRKDSASHIYGLTVYVKEGLLLHGIPLEILTYVCDWLYFNQCLTSFSSIVRLRIYLRFLIHLTDEPLSINLSANVFIFEDFNVHHKDWLIFSGGTDRPGELCYNFSISNNLTQIVNFPTRIPD